MNNDYPSDLYDAKVPVPSMKGPFNPSANEPNVIIENLLLMPTGTFQNPFIRHYQTNVNQSTIGVLMDKLNENPYTAITPKFIANYAPTLVTVNPIGIQSNLVPNGWNNERLRFILVVRIKNERLGRNDRLAYFQGYTDHAGFTQTGALDPNMIFYINSFLVLEEMIISTPSGVAKTYRQIESSNVLPAVSMTNPNTASLRYIRPNDVFQGMQFSHITESYNNLTVFDTREQMNDPVRSFKINNNNNEYLSKIIKNYLASSNDIHQNRHEYGSLVDAVTNPMLNVYQSAIDDDEAKPLVSTNPFIKQLAIAQGTSYRSVTSFTLKILSEICNYLPNVTKIIQPSGSMRRSMPNTADSEYWSARNRETVAATIIYNSLSAIMFDLMITKIRFTSTNMTINGKPATMIGDVKSLIETDITPSVQSLIFRFENEIMPSLTFNNQDSYQVQIEIDIFGHAVINIAFEGQPMVRYVNPSFADSTFSPIITNNPETKNNIVNDISFMLENISSADSVIPPVARPSQPVQNTNIPTQNPFSVSSTQNPFKIK